MSKVKVSKIVLVVNGKEIELTIEEAKELNGMLGELFDQKEKTVVVEYPYYPYVYVKPYWNEPWITWSSNVSYSGNTSILTLTNLSETVME